MIENCPEMSSHEAILLAKVYQQEGRRIVSQSAQNCADIHEMICRNIVGYTNLAFACEVALKVLIVCHNGAVPKTPRGHSLKHLYEQLRGDIQTAISYMTIEFCNRKLINQVYTAEMFESDLEKYSHAFEQARYWYERKEDMSTKEAGLLFISSFSEALIFLVTKMEESSELSK